LPTRVSAISADCGDRRAERPAVQLRQREIAVRLALRTCGRFILQAGSPDYFATMGTRILKGRAFDETDRSGGPPVVVVSEGRARAIWPAEDAIGECIRIGADTAPCSR